MKNLDLEKLLANSGIRTLDSETKQMLYMHTILLELYKLTKNQELKNEIESFFLKALRS
jgi:hypothetical protein